MSWHSKWATIKHRKGAKDAQKWKIFWKHAKLIEIAARWWADPEKNSALAMAIENAKSENVPNDNIQRSIKKGSWEWKNASIYEEILYEWYLPWWVAIIVEVLTDNKNRSVSNVRCIISKSWWNLWENWSVNWMFDHKWEIQVNIEWKDLEEFELMVLESWADDFEISEDKTESFITTNNKNLWSTRDYLKSKWYEIIKASLAWVANQKIEITDLQKAQSIIKVTDAIEEDDDVLNVYMNAEFSDEIIDNM